MMFGVATGAILAAVYWTIAADTRPRPLWAALVKAGSVPALAAAALHLGAPPAITAGLALGALGDFALARPGNRWFLAGMAAFAAGHSAYIAAFLALGAHLPPAWLAVPLIALALSTEVWLSPRTGTLRTPVRGYVAIIIAMALAAGGLPTGHTTLQTGVALFVASDLLLALDRFVLSDPRLRRACAIALWPMYWGGQALILLGALPLPPPLP